MTYLIQLLARIGQTPEFLATVATALIPIIVRLVTMILEKKTTDVRRITVKSSSGKSVTINLTDMSDEDAKKTVQRLHDLT